MVTSRVTANSRLENTDEGCVLELGLFSSRPWTLRGKADCCCLHSPARSTLEQPGQGQGQALPEQEAPQQHDASSSSGTEQATRAAHRFSQSLRVAPTPETRPSGSPASAQETQLFTSKASAVHTGAWFTASSNLGRPKLYLDVLFGVFSSVHQAFNLVKERKHSQLLVSARPRRQTSNPWQSPTLIVL